ncbi:hypothetical protein [Wenxinia saemankumensis]|nr:hypothetical protein [Wenxinia saemankumensis]
MDRFDGRAEFPACKAHLGGATARPAFARVRRDQQAHFAMAD